MAGPARWLARMKAIEPRQRPRSSAVTARTSAVRRASKEPGLGMARPAQYPAMRDSRYGIASSGGFEEVDKGISADPWGR